MKSIAIETGTAADTPPAGPGPALYLDVIEIIISILASEGKRHSKELSRCALVCRDWCNVVRKNTFTDITVLNANRARRLRDLLVSTPHTTFAKHIRTAKIQIGSYADRNPDRWDDAKDLLTLLKTSFPSSYQLKLHIGFDIVYSRHFSDILSSGAAPNLVSLTFRQCTIFADPKELAPLICDESLPSLKVLTIGLVHWDSEDSDTTGEVMDCTPCNDIGVSRTFCRSLDTLTLKATPTKYEVLDNHQQMYWPHQLFSELRVETLIFQLSENYTHPLWSEALTMLTVLSPNLTELDISYRWFNYEAIARILPKIEFSGLKKLKLKLSQGVEILSHLGGASESATTSTWGTEPMVADILGLIMAPQLRCVHTHIYASYRGNDVTDDNELSEDSTNIERWKLRSGAIRWEILDCALESLRLKGLLNAYFGSLSERDWELSGIPEREASNILKEQLPRSVSKGLLVKYQGYDYS